MNLTFSSRRYLFAILGLIVFIFSLTHLPGRIVPNELRRGVGDKFPHFLLYAPLTWLILQVLRRSAPSVITSAFRSSLKPTRGINRYRLWTTLRLIVALLLVGFIGAVDEWTQPAFGRSCSLWDWLADMSGATATVIFVGFRRAKVFSGRLEDFEAESNGHRIKVSIVD